jgi:hypothetical protein
VKLLLQGHRGKAICEHCGPVSTTYFYRDVPLSGSQRLVKNILVGICDTCDAITSIPAQSTPAIKTQREKATKSIEAVLPAPYLDVLDMAAFKISSNSTTEMRKFLVLSYLHKYLKHRKRFSDWTAFESTFCDDLHLPTKRLSFKVSPQVAFDFLTVKDNLHMNKTDTLKTIIHDIKEDILDRGHLSPEIELIAKMTLA